MGSGGTGLGIGGAAEAGTTAGAGALAAITGGLAAAVLEAGAGLVGGVIIVLVGVMAAGGGVLVAAICFGGPEVFRFGASSGVAGAAAFADGREALGAAFAGALAGAVVVVLDATGVALGGGDVTGVGCLDGGVAAGAAVSGALGFALASGFFAAPESVSVTSMETTWSRRTSA